VHIEILGIIAGIFILISFKLSGELKIRSVNIVGAILFVIYGVIIGAWSVWLLNAALFILHVYKIAQLRADKEAEAKMIRVGQKEDKISYSERASSYGVFENDKGQIAVVNHKKWGLILPGGQLSEKEKPEAGIKRETLEETGYEINDLKYFASVDAYYKLDLKVRKMGLIDCHNIADFYTGKMTNKLEEPTEEDIKLEWYYPNELFGKLALDFQNVILERIYK